MNAKKSPPDGENNPEKQDPEEHDTSFLSSRTIFSGILGFVLLILVAVGLASLLFAIYPRLTPSSPSTLVSGQPTSAPPGPGLQQNPALDLQNYQATETAFLGSYAWINQKAGVVRIPIDQAMQIMVQQGMPTLAPAPEITATPAPNLSGPAAQGAQLYNSLGCIGCHGPALIGPSLQGVFNSQVTLQNGDTVTADEAYLRESILNPQAKIVKGFGPIMPNFQGKVSDDQLNQLIAYIEALK